MIGGLKQTTSRLAIAAAAGLFMGGIALTPAQAADLGGDCCADLEERVAELEATTVRKGNRKVSVKLSGQINRQILWWDDGVDSDVFLTDGAFTHSRWRLTGSATISPGRTAGFRYENDVTISNDPKSINNCNGTVSLSANGTQQCMATPNAQSVDDLRYAELWIKDDKLGKVSLGQGDTASNGTAEVDLSGTGFLGGSSIADNLGAFTLRNQNSGFTGTTVGSFYSNIDGGSRQDRIRYDTPTFGGFTLSTSYAADDFVDFAARFAKEWNSVRCAAAIGYAHDTNEKNDDVWKTSGSASCVHTPSGLNLTIAGGELDNGNTPVYDADFFYVKVGISRRWNSHGKTSISVGYGTYDDFASNGSEMDGLAIEAVQAIDSAALELYAGYYTYEFDDASTNNYKDMDAVITGARIKF